MRARTEASAALKQALAKRYWTVDDARQVLAACAASGLSEAEFGRREGIGAQRLGWWRRRLGAAQPPGAPVLPAFVPVRLVTEAEPQAPGRRASPKGVATEPSASPACSEPAAARTSSSIEVVLLSGRRLVVGPDFDAGAVSRLVCVLEEVGRC